MATATATATATAMAMATGVPGGFVAHWSFDDSGADSTGDHDATLPPGWGPVVGVRGGAIRLRGQGAINAGPIPALGGASEASVSAWVRTSRLAKFSVFDASVDPSNDFAGELLEGALRLDHGNAAGGAGGASSDDDTYSLWDHLGTWQHVVFSFSGTNSESHVWVNGEPRPVGWTAVPPATLTDLGNIDFLIGLGSVGEFDEVYLYDRALDGAEAVALYDHDVPRIADDVLAHWPLDGNGEERTGAHPGTPAPEVSFVPGPLGLAASFDGNSAIDVVSLGNKLDSKQKLTVSFWARSDDPKTNMAPWHCSLNTNTEVMPVLLNGTWGLEVDNQHATADAPWSGAQQVAWHHYTFQFDGTRMVGDRGRLHVDGKNTPLSADTLPASLGALTGAVCSIGGYPVLNQSLAWRGEVDDVVVYRRNLSAVEMQRWRVRGLYAVPADAVAHYDLESDLGDSLGNFPLTSLDLDPTFAHGVWGQGVEVDDFVAFDTGIPAAGTTAFTVSMWFRDDETTANASSTFFEIVEAAEGASLIVGVDNNDRLFVTMDNATDTATADTDYAPITPAQWHHLALVFDGTVAASGQRLHLYIDGADAGLPALDAPATVQGTGNLHLNHAGTAGLEGMLDDVYVYDRALRPDEIDRLYERPLP